MKALDRALQRRRIAKARPFVADGDRVLDVGCGEGELFERLGARLGHGVGVDPALTRAIAGERFELHPGPFPDAVPAEQAAFDVITLLAVLEHIPLEAQPGFAAACARHLAPGGRVVITVPSPRVDRILDLLTALRLVDGMELEQHYGFDPTTTPALFEGAGLRQREARRFQLGLNNLFVFERPA